MSTDPTDGELPKLDLLIKIMKMTSAEEGIALIALRKANSMLAAEGWDWERLLRGKVKIIANPFASGGGPVIPDIQTRKAAPPRPQSPPPPPPANPFAANPWPSGKQPRAKKQPFDPYENTTPPPRPTAPPVAPAGPLHFRKTSADFWAIASHIKLDVQMVGSRVHIAKRDGSQTEETIGPFIEQSPSGHYLYQIAKASKWKRKAADTFNINDLTP